KTYSYYNSFYFMSEENKHIEANNDKHLNETSTEDGFSGIPYVVTAEAMASKPVVEIQYLLEPFLPIGATALIAGKPDTGKSLFARQLATEIAQNSSTFLGFKLNPVYKRALYISTEDGEQSVQVITSKQHEGLGYTP